MIYWGLLLVFVLEYVRPVSYMPALQPLRLNTLVPVLLAVTSLFAGPARVPTQQLLSETNTKLVLGFLGLLVVSALTADVTEYALNMLTLVGGYVLLYWIVAQQVTDLRRITGVFKVLIFVHLVVTALNPQLFAGGRQYIASNGFMGDGNDFALSVNIVIPMCLFLAFESVHARQRLFYTLALAVLVMDVVLTQSRGGTLALACVGFFYWLRSERKLAMTAGGVCAVVFILLLAPPSYFERMHTIGDTEEGSARGRIDAWKAGVAMAVDNPLLGVGAGHFGVMHGARYGGLNQTAHSIYFLVLGELGLPGILLFIAIIWANFAANRRVARRLDRRSRDGTRVERQLMASASAALIAYATGGAFLSAAYYPHLFVLCGLLAASRRWVEARLAAEESGAILIPTAVGPAVGPGLSPYFVPQQARSLVSGPAANPRAR